MRLPCPAKDTKARAVGRPVDDAMIDLVQSDLIHAGKENFVAGASDFVFPTEDFCGREEVAELINDFGCGDQFGEEISILGFELPGGDRL